MNGGVIGDLCASRTTGFLCLWGRGVAQCASRSGSLGNSAQVLAAAAMFRMSVDVVCLLAQSLLAQGQ